MKIGIIGLPLYAAQLTKRLNDYSSEHQFYHFDTYYKTKDKIRFVLMVPFLDCVYSINGSLTKSFVFSLSTSLIKRVIMNWSGTDVLHNFEAQKKGEINEEIRKRTIHTCQAKWILEELKELKINAQIKQFQYYETERASNLPSKFKVLIRIGKNREEFYGINETLAVVKALPNIQFTVVGIGGYKDIEYPNLTYLSWVDGMDDIFADHTVSFRLPKHDGLSPFIMESLAKGMYCLYKYKLDGTVQVNDSQDAINQILEWKESFDSGNLSRNEKGYAYIETFHKKKEVLDSLIELMTK